MSFIQYVQYKEYGHRTQKSESSRPVQQSSLVNRQPYFDIPNTHPQSQIHSHPSYHYSSYPLRTMCTVAQNHSITYVSQTLGGEWCCEPVVTSLIFVSRSSSLARVFSVTVFCEIIFQVRLYHNSISSGQHMSIRRVRRYRYMYMCQ